jgi:hypothetical protein
MLGIADDETPISVLRAVSRSAAFLVEELLGDRLPGGHGNRRLIDAS